MIDPAQRTQQAATAAAPASACGRPQTQKAQSFTAALSSELSKRAGLDGETPASPANSPLGQQNVIGRDSVGSSASPVASLASAANPAQPTNLSEFVIPIPSATSATTPAATTSSATTPTSTSGTTTGSFDDAYWAAQPAAVQQLRTIQDPTERAEVATQLADEGYSIDVPIMVWGWDPQITTQARESLGYTWVPSALQQPVEVAPGLTFNGATYNASNPPPGSITV